MCVCVHARVCVSHLPFQPGEQHEADLWPLGLWFHHVPVSRVMRLTYVGCCCVCIWPISDSTRSSYPHTHMHTCTWNTARTAHFWIHKSMSFCSNECVVKFVGMKRVSAFLLYMHVQQCVCVCVYFNTSTSPVSDLMQVWGQPAILSSDTTNHRKASVIALATPVTT